MKRYHATALQTILLSQLSSYSRAFSSSSTAAVAFKSRSHQLGIVGAFDIIDKSSTHHRQSNIGGIPRTIHRGCNTRRNMSSQQEEGVKNLVVDPFCYRQFAEKESSKGYAGAVFNISIEKFEEIVNSQYNPSNLQEGYAPFCKHLFLTNDFSDARVNVLPITPDNEQYLRTRYEARNDKELPVLTRYFDRELLLKDKEESDVFPVAKYIDLILYSREQIEKENAAMGKDGVGEGKREKAPWGIVSIKAQDVNRELPMTPITAMRNALGKDQGGSGVELVREAYMEAVEYWKDHANVL